MLILLTYSWTAGGVWGAACAAGGMAAPIFNRGTMPKPHKLTAYFAALRLTLPAGIHIEGSHPSFSPAVPLADRHM